MSILIFRFTTTSKRFVYLLVVQFGQLFNMVQACVRLVLAHCDDLTALSYERRKKYPFVTTASASFRSHFGSSSVAARCWRSRVPAGDAA